MKLISVKRVCELLDVMKSTVYAWARNGTIPSYRPGGIIRFDPDEVIEWVKSQKTKPANVYTLPENVSKNQDIDSIIKKAIEEATGTRYNPSQRGNQTDQPGEEVD